MIEQSPIEKIEDEFTILYSKETEMAQRINIFEDLYKQEKLYVKANDTAITEYLKLFDIKFPENKPRKNIFLERVINACLEDQTYGGYKWELVRK